MPVLKNLHTYNTKVTFETTLLIMHLLSFGRIRIVKYVVYPPHFDINGNKTAGDANSDKPYTYLRMFDIYIVVCPNMTSITSLLHKISPAPQKELVAG